MLAWEKPASLSVSLSVSVCGCVCVSLSLSHTRTHARTHAHTHSHTHLWMDSDCSHVSLILISWNKIKSVKHIQTEPRTICSDAAEIVLWICCCCRPLSYYSFVGSFRHNCGQNKCARVKLQHRNWQLGKKLQLAKKTEAQHWRFGIEN